MQYTLLYPHKNVFVKFYFPFLAAFNAFRRKLTLYDFKGTLKTKLKIYLLPNLANIYKIELSFIIGILIAKIKYQKPDGF